jgi:hypothetical protein
MSEQSYVADILFKEESAAEAFCAGIEKQLGVSDPDLNKALRNMGASIDEDETEFSLDKLRRYRNVANLHFYCGRGEHDEIIKAFFRLGAHLIRLHVHADEYNELELYAGGKRVKKAKEFNKEYDALAIPDVHLEFARYVTDGNYKKARALLSRINADKVPLDDPLLTSLTEPGCVDITLHLMEQGVLMENHRVGPDHCPLMVQAAYCANLPLLKAMFERGFNPYDADDGDEEEDNNGSTVLHALFYCDKAEAVIACEYVAERCRDNLNPVTQDGSPLWFAYQEQCNIASVPCFRERGAQIIAPPGFYDALGREERVLEAAKHNDLPMLQQHYQAEDHESAVSAALYHQALEVVVWLDAQQAIDWLSNVSSNQFGEAFVRPTPRYETPFMWTNGNNADLAFAEYIVDATAHDAVARDRLAVYLAGFDRAGPLLRKLHRYGATLGAACIEHGESVFPLDRVVSQNRLENAEVLLELGSAVPPPDEDGASWAATAVRYNEENSGAWQKLMKQRGLS